LYTMNIMAIAQIQPLDPIKFKGNQTMNDVISTDSIIEQILMLTVSLYALSTELRFWDENIKKEAPESSLPVELINDYKQNS